MSVLTTIKQETIVTLCEERIKQYRKFGQEPLASNSQMVAILGEEFGEICRAVCQELPKEELDKEVMQLAAVCIAYLDGDLHFGNAQ